MMELWWAGHCGQVVADVARWLKVMVVAMVYLYGLVMVAAWYLYDAEGTRRCPFIYEGALLTALVIYRSKQQQVVEGERRCGGGGMVARGGEVQWMRRENRRFMGRCGGDVEWGGEGEGRTGGRSMAKEVVDGGEGRVLRGVGASGVGRALRWVVLLWMVGGEAVGGAEVGARAEGVVAAAAVAVGGFWAARVMRDWGDVNVRAKPEGATRIWIANVRRIKRRAGGVEGGVTDPVIYGTTMEAMDEAGVDVLGLVDTGVDDAEAPAQSALWGAGGLKLATQRGWGGEHMLWQHSQGPLGVGEAGRRRVRRSGSALAVHGRLRGYGGRVLTDASGFARYVARVLVGTNGLTLVVVAVHLPSESAEDGLWKQQAEWLRGRREELAKREREGSLTKDEREVLRAMAARAEPNPKVVALAGWSLGCCLRRLGRRMWWWEEIGTKRCRGTRGLGG